MNACPFCGSDQLELYWQQTPDAASEDDKGFSVVTCLLCGADGPVADDEDTAWALWNRTAADWPPDEHIPAVVKRLVRAYLRQHPRSLT